MTLTNKHNITKICDVDLENHNIIDWEWYSCINCGMVQANAKTQIALINYGKIVYFKSIKSYYRLSKIDSCSEVIMENVLE